MYQERKIQVGDPIRGFMNKLATVGAIQQANWCGPFVLIQYGDKPELSPGAGVDKYQWIDGAWELPDDERSVRAGRD